MSRRGTVTLTSTRWSPRPKPWSTGIPRPAQDAHLARLRARVELELDRAVERLDADRGADGGLDDRQVDLREDVVSLADEALVGADAHADVDVAGAAAERARVPLAGEADPLAVVDAGRDVDLELALLERAPRAVARLARMLDDAAGAAALRAGRLADELAEDAARDLLEPAGPAAALTGDDVRAGSGAVAAAGLAGGRQLDGDRRPWRLGRLRRGRS